MRKLLVSANIHVNSNVTRPKVEYTCIILIFQSAIHNKLNNQTLLDTALHINKLPSDGRESIKPSGNLSRCISLGVDRAVILSTSLSDLGAAGNVTGSMPSLSGM